MAKIPYSLQFSSASNFRSLLCFIFVPLIFAPPPPGEKSHISPPPFQNDKDSNTKFPNSLLFSSPRFNGLKFASSNFRPHSRQKIKEDESLRE